MNPVTILTGLEQLPDAELQNYAFYVKHEKCPLNVISYTKNGDIQRTNVHLGTLKKLNKDQSKFQHLKSQGPIFYNDVHTNHRVQPTQTGWYVNDYQIADGFIIQMRVTELVHGWAPMSELPKNVGNIYFRVRETAPYVEVNLRRGYGMPPLIKGRLDRLSQDFLIRNKIIGGPAMMKSISDDHLNRFLDVQIKKAALKELGANIKVHTYSEDDDEIEIVSPKKARKVSSLI